MQHNIFYFKMATLKQDKFVPNKKEEFQRKKVGKQY